MARKKKGVLEAPEFNRASHKKRKKKVKHEVYGQICKNDSEIHLNKIRTNDIGEMDKTH